MTWVQGTDTAGSVEAQRDASPPGPWQQQAKVPGQERPALEKGPRGWKEGRVATTGAGQRWCHPQGSGEGTLPSLLSGKPLWCSGVCREFKTSQQPPRRGTSRPLHGSLGGRGAKRS